MNQSSDLVRGGAFRIDVAEAEQLITDALPEYPSRSVPLHAARGQILRQAIVAERDQPPFDRATMDGIALNHAALADDHRILTLAGIQAAGKAALSLPDIKHCTEIMTGAVLTEGADTVVPVERIRVDHSGSVVEIEKAYEIQAGQFIHRRASDHAKGDTLLEPGTVIRAPEMAILTAAGKSHVSVGEWPDIAIISTGDELVDVGGELQDFQIRSSNDRAIEAALQQRGCFTTTRKHISDDRAVLLQKVAALHESTGAMILSGGVSMGKYDYVPGILQELGIEIIFHKVLQRPGLPMWFGMSRDGKPVFALPGNPVSTLVCLVRYVIPALQRAVGLTESRGIRVCLSEDVQFSANLSWFLPVVLQQSDNGQTVAVPKPTNTSGDFIGLRGTDGFIELPRGQDSFPKGFPGRYFGW